MPASKKKSDKRSECVMVRLTPAEYRTVKQSIKGRDTNPAAFIREAGIARARGVEITLPRGATPAMRKVAKEIDPWRAVSLLNEGEAESLLEAVAPAAE